MILLASSRLGEGAMGNGMKAPPASSLELLVQTRRFARQMKTCLARLSARDGPRSKRPASIARFGSTTIPLGRLEKRSP